MGAEEDGCIATGLCDVRASLIRAQGVWPGVRRPGPPQGRSPALTPGQRPAQRAALSTPGMGDRLGVKVPWRKRWC